MRDKFEVLLAKEREVHAFLDAFDATRRGLADEQAAAAADARAILETITRLDALGNAVAPDADKLQRVRDELEYKTVQKHNSADTTVPKGRKRALEGSLSSAKHPPDPPTRRRASSRACSCARWS